MNRRRAPSRHPRLRPALIGGLLVVTLAPGAEELPPPDRFGNQVAARFASHLCEVDYMRCLGADRRACHDAVTASRGVCPADALYDAVVRPHATAAHAAAAIKDAGIALGDCVTAEVERALALRFDDHPRCYREFAARSAQ